MPGTANQAEWVLRVLQVDVVGQPVTSLAGDTAEAVPLPKPARSDRKAPMRYPSIQGRAIWQAARDDVDGQFAALQRHLQSTEDPELHRIAQYGLGALTGRLGVKILTALIEMDTAPVEKAADTRQRTLDAISGYRQFLAGDSLVKLLEENPFGVAVAIRAPLAGALDDIEHALQQH